MDEEWWRRMQELLDGGGPSEFHTYRDAGIRTEMYRLCHSYEQGKATIPDTLGGIIQECPSWIKAL
jgi:hypothetical protein